MPASPRFIGRRWDFAEASAAVLLLSGNLGKLITGEAGAAWPSAIVPCTPHPSIVGCRHFSHLSSVGMILRPRAVKYLAQGHTAPLAKAGSERQDEGRALASLSLSVLACKWGVRIWGWLGARVHHGRVPRSGTSSCEEPVRSCLAWGLKTSCWVFKITFVGK